MFDNNYDFGMADILCDGHGCNAEITNIEGFDGHVPSFDTLMEEMESNGWQSRRVGSEWLHLCGDCIDERNF